MHIVLNRDLEDTWCLCGCRGKPLRRDQNREICNFFVTEKTPLFVCSLPSVFSQLIYSLNTTAFSQCLSACSTGPYVSLLCKSRHSWIQSTLPTSPWKPWLTVKKESSANTQPFNSDNLCHIHLMLPGSLQTKMSYNNNLKEAYSFMADMLPHSWLLTLGSKFSSPKAITSLVSKAHHILAYHFLKMVLWVDV